MTKKKIRGLEYIRSWVVDIDGRPARLELYDTKSTRGQHHRLGYRFFHRGDLIFEGDDFFTPDAIDGDSTVAALFSFLALRPGDTDSEYFTDYTEDQLSWVESYGEELALVADEIRGE